MMSIDVVLCTDDLALYHRYARESGPQPAYIELDLPNSRLRASYNDVIGNAVPPKVWHGFCRRYGIPVLAGPAANRTLEGLAPLAARVVADWRKVWDGDNWVAKLGDDARAAEQEIVGYLAGAEFEFDDLVTEWDIDGVVTGDEIDEFGITAATSDEDLREIEAEIVGALPESSSGGVVVCPGLFEHLCGVRDGLRDDDRG